MDQGSRAPHGRGGLPRLSRLPLPRSQPSLPSSSHSEDSKSSQLPRPSTQASTSIKPLGESNNAPLQSRYGFSSLTTRVRNSSPARDAMEVSQAYSLDTTPPKQRLEIPIIEGDENAAEPIHLATNRRKPRPSLSERTIETLSQVQPSPSPTRRRSSIAARGSDGHASMGQSNRPPSAVRGLRSTSPSLTRSPSPSKRPFKPPGPQRSPVKGVPPMPPLPISSTSNIYTPPRAFLRGRPSNPVANSRKSTSGASVDTQSGADFQPTTLQPVKVKSMRNLKKPETTTRNSSQPLSSVFTDPGNSKKKLQSNVNKSGPVSSSRTLNNSSSRDNTLKSTSITAKQTPPSSRSIFNESSSKMPENGSKSSSTLRETIARAKAAKNAAMMQVTTEDLPDFERNGDADSGIDVSIDPSSFKKKLSGAVTSGVLNVSALSLKSFPEEVLSMYEFDESSNIGWSEAIDLVKFIAADNEIQQIPDHAFPDWSEEELMADSDKNNMFAGLELLDFHGNELRSVPVGFRRLGRIHVLNLNKNMLDYDSLPPLCSMISLRELRIANNKLSGALPEQIRALVHLQVLDLSNNSITEIPTAIGELKSLQRLVLAGNQLSSMPTESLQSLPLIELNLARNRLNESILGNEMFNSTLLQDLDISANGLDSLSVEELILPALESLSIYGNRLQTFPSLSKCPNLRTLNASDNHLSQFPNGFAKLQKLRSVDVSGNALKSLDSDLIHMQSLTAISLAGNPLRERKYLTMNADDLKADLAKKVAPTNFDAGSKASNGGSELAEDISTNNGSSSTKYHPKNGILDLSSLGLSRVDTTLIDFDTKSSQQIHTIRLSNNNLDALPVELLTHPSIRASLKSLDISHNLTLHPTNYLTSTLELQCLQHLYIVSTGMTSLDPLTTYLSAPKLMELNISCHRLTGNLPKLRTWFPSLITLLATDNWFSGMEVEAVQGIEILDITNNEIEVLQPKIGLLGNHSGKMDKGRLRQFECSGNRFRVPRVVVLERGTEAVLKDLRRMVSEPEVPPEWKDEI